MVSNSLIIREDLTCVGGYVVFPERSLLVKNSSLIKPNPIFVKSQAASESNVVLELRHLFHHFPDPCNHDQYFLHYHTACLSGKLIGPAVADVLTDDPVNSASRTASAIPSGVLNLPT